MTHHSQQPKTTQTKTDSRTENSNQGLAYIAVVLKGMAMGAADVVPGVSGGTIAFILGIYERWVGALSSIGIDAVKKLFSEGFGAAWRHIDGTFLLSLFVGIGISLFSLAKGIKWLMENQPIFLWSFFFGLVVASVIVLVGQIRREAVQLGMHHKALFFIGMIVAAIISVLPVAQGGQVGLLFLFFAGALAICAMVLPGISGSFILVLIGAYETFIHALSEVNIAALLSFAAGAGIGLLSFARVLKWLFGAYHSATLSLMTGFVAGSLVKIWPWKAAGSSYPALPSLGADAQVGLALVAMLIGFMVILAMESWAKRSNQPDF